MDKVSKNKNRVKVTEYTISQIDQDGEIVNVLGCKEKKLEAIDAAKSYVSNKVLAVVVEKVITRYPMHLHNDPRTWDVVFTIGNEAALKRGDWI